MTVGAWHSDDWRPIGSAPRDGREILAKDEFGRKKRCRWVGPPETGMPVQISVDEAGPIFTPAREGEWVTTSVPAEAFEPTVWTPIRTEPGR